MRISSSRSAPLLALLALLAMAAGLALACRPPPPASPFASPSAVGLADPCSYAEPSKVTLSHVSLDLRADFVTRTLAGTATLSLTWLDPGARTLVLDTRELVISKVEAEEGATWTPVRHELAAAERIYGSKLTVHLRGQPPRVRVTYVTSPRATGLQWTPAERTLGKRLPFLYTQSQWLHARSWVPLQDTPSVRFTYDAQLVTPDGMMALMSAHNDPRAPRGAVHHFIMDQPIPSYLLALAVGELEHRAISPRAGVWAEPALIERAARGLEDTEKMMVVAERLFGPYRWGRFDMLVVPESFPFLGMENPRLTFLSPMIFAGDESRINVVAHELAHSWAGNQVTNATWSDLWLHEGFASYMAFRICEELYGREVAAMSVVLDRQSLMSSISREPHDDQLLARPPLDGRSPGDIADGVAYRKGGWFLSFLEQRFGRADFDAFLRRWFATYAFRSATTLQFEQLVEGELMAKQPGKLTAAELRAWLHEPGVPETAPPPVSKRLDDIDAVALSWEAGFRKTTELPAASWRGEEWERFLWKLRWPVAVDKVAELDAVHHLSETEDGLLAARWYALAELSGYAPARPAIRRFLIAHGQRGLVEWLYKVLARTPSGLSFAVATFAEARAQASYTTVTAARINLMLRRLAGRQ
jgi:leukotriene-A4 hydrolase